MSRVIVVRTCVRVHSAVVCTLASARLHSMPPLMTTDDPYARHPRAASRKEWHFCVRHFYIKTVNTCVTYVHARTQIYAFGPCGGVRARALTITAAARSARASPYTHTHTHERHEHACLLYYACVCVCVCVYRRTVDRQPRDE